MAILSKKREMDYTKKMMETNELLVYKATPEEIEEMLKGGKHMANKVGRPKGSKNKSDRSVMIQNDKKANDKKPNDKKCEKNESGEQLIHVNAKAILPAEISFADSINEPFQKNESMVTFKSALSIGHKQACIDTLSDFIIEKLDEMEIENATESIEMIKNYCVIALADLR